MRVSNSPNQTKYLGSRVWRVLTLSVVLFVATAGAAFADTGTYIRYAKKVEFFFAESAGDASSYDFSGYGTAKLCADAPTSSSRTFYVAYMWNRTLQPDDIMKEQFRVYSDPRYVSASFSTQSDRKYHTDATWNYVPNVIAETHGYSKAIGGTC